MIPLSDRRPFNVLVSFNIVSVKTVVEPFCISLVLQLEVGFRAGVREGLLLAVYWGKRLALS